MANNKSLLWILGLLGLGALGIAIFKATGSGPKITSNSPCVTCKK